MLVLAAVCRSPACPFVLCRLFLPSPSASPWGGGEVRNAVGRPGFARSCRQAGERHPGPATQCAHGVVLLSGICAGAVRGTRGSVFLSVVSGRGRGLVARSAQGFWGRRFVGVLSDPCC